MGEWVNVSKERYLHFLDAHDLHVAESQTDCGPNGEMFTLWANVNGLGVAKFHANFVNGKGAFSYELFTEESPLKPLEWLRSSVSDAISNLFYYDRKDCDEMSVEDLQKCIESGEITKEHLIEFFKEEIENQFK